MTGDRTDQLEIQFDGGIVEIKANGLWERVLDRRRLLASGAAGAALLAVLGGNAGAAVRKGAAPRRGGAKPGDGKTIGMSLIGTTEYVLCAVTGAIKAFEGTGYKFVARQAAFNAGKELANIEDLVVQKVDGLLVLPTSVQSSSRGVLKAKAAGIPCTNIVWSGKTPGDSAYVGVVLTDNEGGGKLTAEYIMKKKPGGAKILVVQGTPGQGFSETLNDGLEKYLKPEWQVVQTGNGNYVRSTSIDVTQTMLTAHPDADVIFTHSAGMGAAVASYLQKKKRRDILHISSDANHEMVEWLDKGWITATRYFSAAESGVMGITYLRDYMEKGKKPSQFVNKLPQQMLERKDLVSHPPPAGAVNPKLKPALGYYCFDKYMAIARKI
jgi:ribose transport system substrate-binding protein